MEHEEVINYIHLLLLHDLTSLCFQIFNYLDNKTFTNCRLVCHNWKNFIDHYFFELAKGKKCVNQRLSSNFFNEKYGPRIIKKVLISNYSSHHKDCISRYKLQIGRLIQIKLPHYIHISCRLQHYFISLILYLFKYSNR